MFVKKLKTTIKWVVRFLFLLSLQTLAWVLIDIFLEGVIITNFYSAIFMGLVLSLFNAAFWPFLSRITLKISVLTFGIFNIILASYFTLVASNFVPGVYIAGIWSALFATFALTLINILFSFFLSISNEQLFYKEAFSRGIKYEGTNSKPGIIFIEIDGLSEPVLKKATNLGYAPFLKSVIESTHKLKMWETDYSCQTGASQIGILHGNNKNIPAFRWVDKRTGKIISSSSTKNVGNLEKLHGNNKGLLVGNGGSRSNMYSGDAKDTIFTSSTLNDLEKLKPESFHAFFNNPYNLARTLLLFIWEIILEFFNFYSQRAKDIKPRLGTDKRGGTYPFVRGFTNVVLREITVYALINDIIKGQKDVIYATFFGYDELAHHSGVEDKDTFEHLKKIDKDLEKLYKVSNRAKREYKFVYLSDHGQSKGATFKQRYGITLEELVNQNTDSVISVQGNLETNESLGNIHTFNKTIELGAGSFVSKVAKKIRRSKKYKNLTKEQKKHSSNISVLASGNLGLVYFNDYKNRLTLEQINKKYPNLIDSLVSHPGIGFISLKSKNGFVAIGKKGKIDLKTERVTGKNPLAGFRKNLPIHLIRSNSFSNAPDIFVNSTYYKSSDEVAAFEELIGNHGGAGGNQWKAMVCFPKDFEYPKVGIVGAESLHRQFKKWVKNITLE